MKNNFRRSINHKMLFVITLLIPIILCLITGSIKLGRTSLRVGILESNASEIQRENQKGLYEILRQSKDINYEIANKGTLHTDLLTGKYHLILDYRNSISNDDFVLITYQSENKKLAMLEIFKGAIRKGEYINLSGLSKVGINETERTLALLLTLFMILSTIPTAAIIRDKQSGTYERYQFARSGSIGYIQGFIIHTFLIALAQVILCLTVLDFLQKNFMLSLLTGTVIGVIIAGIATMFSTLICLASKSEMQANITASSLAAVMSLLGGTFIAIESMPRLLQVISLVSPMRWIVELARIM
jgi:ABC-2 type transport system permease protein